MEQRLMDLRREKDEIDQEIAQLQGNLDDFIDPLREKADIIALRYIENGLFHLPHNEQRARIDGWAGQDDTLAAMAWDIIREKGGWGGD